MKKLFLIIWVIAGFVSCAKDESGKTGSIYGVVTIEETAEPMRATGIELYRDDLLLLKTVTYDDGHYEFENLVAGEYKLRVVASGYVNTSYNVVVESGRTARADMQLVRLQTYMTVRTLDATNVGSNSATLSGKYTCSDSRYNPSEVGFVYSTTPTPSNDGTKITCTKQNSFSCEINNLKKGTYYYQAYAKNTIGIEYGEVHTFEISGLPVVSTLGATNIAETTATLNGRIDYAGDPAYTERGFVYSSSYSNPTIDDPETATTKIVVSGTSKEFSANIAGLTEKTIHYVRAYAMNNAGTVYGQSVKFPDDNYIELTADGIMVQKSDISSGANWSSAKDLCSSSNIGGFSDWRLPTTGECKLIYDNYKKGVVFNIIPTDEYWTSTFAYSSVGDYYYYYYLFSSGKTGSAYVGYALRVRCIRTIK